MFKLIFSETPQKNFKGLSDAFLHILSKKQFSVDELNGVVRLTLFNSGVVDGIYWDPEPADLAARIQMDKFGNKYFLFGKYVPGEVFFAGSKYCKWSPVSIPKDAFVITDNGNVRNKALRCVLTHCGNIFQLHEPNEVRAFESENEFTAWTFDF